MAKSEFGELIRKELGLGEYSRFSDSSVPPGNGKGFVVGSVSGTCHLFGTSEGELQLNAVINVRGKKSSGNLMCKITGNQFLKSNTRRMMITSEDSRTRVLYGLEVVHKYRGLAKSGCQMSASLT